MKRREFITLLGGAAALAARGARAAAERVRRIGVLIGQSPKTTRSTRCIAQFRQGAAASLAGPRDAILQIEYRWAAGDTDACTLAAELVASRRMSSCTASTPASAAECAGDTTIPIVFGRCPIRSARASSRAWRGRAAISPASPISNRAWAESGWSCCRSRARRQRGSRFCSIRDLPGDGRITAPTEAAAHVARRCSSNRDARDIGIEIERAFAASPATERRADRLFRRSSTSRTGN